MNRKIGLWIILALLSACHGGDDEPNTPARNYKQDMRDFVIGISAYARTSNSSFLIIPQNGIELVTTSGEDDGVADMAYLNAVSGHGQEDLFYGYDSDDQPTPADDNSYLRTFLDKSKTAGKTILVTDYCSTHTNMDGSYAQNAAAGYVSFAADHRELDNIPTYPAAIHQENNAVVTSLSQVKNFLYLLDPEPFASKAAFISAVTATNYDLLIMDAYFKDKTLFSSAEITQLRNKANGGKRLVVSYMSIGEAEIYRYYWLSAWDATKPSWMDNENPDWPGNFKVKYWEKEWQDIIFGNDNSYLHKITNAGFDGVYLDIIDAFEYYE